MASIIVDFEALSMMVVNLLLYLMVMNQIWMVSCLLASIIQTNLHYQAIDLPLVNQLVHH